jgi:stress response protein SCP2
MNERDEILPYSNNSISLDKIIFPFFFTPYQHKIGNINFLININNNGRNNNLPKNKTIDLNKASNNKNIIKNEIKEIIQSNNSEIINVDILKRNNTAWMFNTFK